ncbi:MAG: rod shape-determining protein MreD [Thermoanaerobacteraceae bacterium]
MRIIYKYLLVLLLIILQSTLFQYISFFGVKPDTVLVVILSFSLLNGQTEAIYLSLFGGLFQDILFNNAIGVNTLPLLLVSYVSGIISKNVFKESTFVASVFVFIGTIVYNLIIMFSMVLMKYHFDFAANFTDIAIKQAIYNTVIIIFFYKYIVIFNRYINDSRKSLFKDM